MYVVKALVAATAPDLPGNNVKWAIGQSRVVHDSLIQQYKNNPAAWEVTSLDTDGQVNIVVSGDAPSDTDGRGDGTIYIQTA